jgi:hypothetical protein|tara:strand:- start:22792 stop:23502 length:711 start_codon:yes stop_codon:yes gene_type:complete
MSNQLFKNFPEIQYTLSTGKIVTIKDFFRKSTIEQDSVNSVISYTFYEIQDGERPDVVADRLYGDSDLHWTFFLVNDMDNYYQWYKDQTTFENQLKEMYPEYWLISNRSTDIVSKDDKWLLGEIIETSQQSGNVISVQPTFNRIGVAGGTWNVNDVVTGKVSGKSFTVSSVVSGPDGIDHYVNSEGLRRNTIDTGFTPVTYYTHDYEVNETNRKIKVIRPEYIRRVVSEFEKVMAS